MERRYPELLQAVRLRYQAAGLDPRQSLIILSSTDNYQPLVRAYYDAAVSLGADPILVTYKTRAPMSGLPQTILSLIAHTDQLVDLSYKTSIYSDSYYVIDDLLKQRGGSRIDGHLWGWEEDLDYIINCPPDAEVTKRAKKAQTVIDSAKILRVTSDLGTDLTVLRGDPSKRRSYLHFPPGQAAISPPEDGVHGLVYFVGAVRIQFPAPYRRLVHEPVRLEFEQGKLVEIDRNNEAGRFLHDWFKSHNDPHAYQFAHINLGVDHRIVLHYLDNMSVHYNYGGILMGVGANYWPGSWGNVKAKSHVELALVGADFLLDGRPILQAGEFTLDSELRV